MLDARSKKNKKIVSAAEAGTRKPARCPCRIGRSALVTVVEPLEMRRLLSTAVWTGAAHDGQWNTANNWQGDAVPASGDDIEFPSLGSSDGTITLASDVTVGNITFDGAGYHLAGSQQITLDGNITANADGNQINSNILLTHETTVTVALGDDLQIESAGDGGDQLALDKQGTGTLTFTGSSTFTGNTNLDQGDIELASGSSLSTAVLPISGTTLYGNNASADDYGGTGGTVLLEDQGAPGTLTSEGIYIETGTTLDETISSSSAGELVAIGTEVNVTGATLEVTRLDGAMLSVGRVITLISNQTGDNVDGTFNNLP